MVAVRVALGILHVADEGVAPVAEPEGAIGADLRVDGAEVFVGAAEEVIGDLLAVRALFGRHDALAGVAGAFVADVKARHAVHVDDAGVDELALDVLRKLAAEQELVADAGAHALVVEDGVHAAAAGDFGAGEGRVPMLLGGGAVADEALAPLVEDVAPGVAVAGRDEVVDLHRAEIDDVRAGRVVRAVRAPRGFDGGAHRDAFELVEQAAVGEFEFAGDVVRVVAGPAVDQGHDEVGFVVAVGVLQEEVSRLVDDDDAAVPEFETGRAVELVVEDGAFVGAAVAVGVFENEQAVAGSRVARLPHGIGRHAADPEAAAVVEVDLLGLGEFGELALAGEEFDFEVLGDLHRLDAFFGREVFELVGFGVVLGWIAEAGSAARSARRCCCRRRAGVFALGDVPDVAIADGGHGADFGDFAGEGFGVPGAAAAVDVPAVEHAVVLEVDPRLVVDGVAEFLEGVRIQVGG